MAEQHVAILEKARERLIEDRRKVAETLAKPWSREVTPGARETMLKLQATIEAIDRVIADEGGKEPPRYQMMFLPT